MIEQLLAENIVPIIVAVGAIFVGLWRIAALEKHIEKQSTEAREDRRRIYEKQEQYGHEMAELKGELRGRGVLNGHTGE